MTTSQHTLPLRRSFWHRGASLLWRRALLIVILACVAGGDSHGQNPVLPTRGVEEVGRVYIGEPVSAYVGHMAMLFVTGKQPEASGGTMQDTVIVEMIRSTRMSPMAPEVWPLSHTLMTPTRVYGSARLDGDGGIPAKRGTSGVRRRLQRSDVGYGAHDAIRARQAFDLGICGRRYSLYVSRELQLAWYVSLVPSVDQFALKNAFAMEAFYSNERP